MKIIAETVEAFFTALPEKEKDLRELDAVIMATLPEVVRRLKTAPSITLLGYWSKSKSELEWPPIGIAPQKNHISLYINGWKDGESLVEHYQGRLGKTSNGVGCIRFKKFNDLTKDELRQILLDAVSPDWSYG
jgi:hypothetical protein